MPRPIGYIVMPPGHGKSVLHNPEVGLYEADQVVYWKEDKSLREARRCGKETGDWSQYDHLWASRMRSLLPKGSIVMVPVHSVGEAMGAQKIGSLYLDWGQWTRNFQQRRGSASKYKRCWEDAQRGGVFVHTNEQTTCQVKQWCEEWIQEEDKGKEGEGGEK